MDFFGHRTAYEHGEGHFSHDCATGLEAIVDVQEPRLGPGLGGCRLLSCGTTKRRWLARSVLRVG